MATSPSQTLQALSTAVLKATKPGGRESWTFSSNYSLAHGTSAIQMTINPNSVSWNQAKRISTAKKTIGGTTYFKWSDKTGRNLDPLILSIKGETGPISGLGQTDKIQSLTAIITENGNTRGSKPYRNGQNWARLYTLTAQPEIDPITFEPTVWQIIYKSMLFPSITLSGFFMEVLKFEDTAASPFSKAYSLTFVVTAVAPDILDLASLIGTGIDTNVASGSMQVTAGESSITPGLA